MWEGLFGTVLLVGTWLVVMMTLMLAVVGAAIGVLLLGVAHVCLDPAAGPEAVVAIADQFDRPPISAQVVS